jgi:hypothetical protein
VDAHEARDAFDHDVAHLGNGPADERNAMGAFVGETGEAQRAGTDPFSARARIAGTAAAEDQPGAPGCAIREGQGRELIVARPDHPVVSEANERILIDG